MIYTVDDFGEDFHWGVSTAAYQIEGAATIDGKGLSIWDEFTRNNAKIKDGLDADSGCNHYDHFQADLDIIRQLDIPNYRFSMAWSRILPNGTGKLNQKGIDFYHRLIDGCLERGITPWITLYHWDLPMALEAKGGWTNRDILNWFEEYILVCCKEYGDRVINWMVLNEPMVFTGAGYFLAYHAPGRKGLNNFLPAMHHAALCQGLGGRVLRSELREAEIGTTFSCSHIDAYSDSDKDVQTAKRFDALLNRLFIETSLGMGYPVDDLPIARRVEDYVQGGDEALMAFDFDFIGLQNYTREVVKHNWLIPYMSGQIVDANNRGVPITTMNWEVYPKSIYHILKKFGQYEGINKIVLTENGAAFNDELTNGMVQDTERTKFLQAYLAEVLRAKKEGVKVDGYFIWTLLDNFEWAEGFTQRFGLVHTDYESKQRTIKSSGYWYGRFLNSAKVHCSLEPISQVTDL